MDVKMTFLNGFLKEELYMMQPEGFVDPQNAGKVCKLQRSIYGLVQASRSWNLCFDEVIKAFGFIQAYGEACIFKKVSVSSIGRQYRTFGKREGIFEQEFFNEG